MISNPLPIAGRLAYGIRCLSDPSALPQFRIDFRDYLGRNAHLLHAALAFPEPGEEVTRLHILLWHKNGNDVDAQALLGLSSKAFGQSPEASNDGFFHTYGKRSGGDREVSEGTVSVDQAVQEKRPCELLEGYLRPPPPVAAATAAPLPMIGIFRRAVQSGLRPELGKSFRAVCEIWHEKVPGILGAMVFADPHDPNLVHDVRIFADKASYDAHVDKTNPDLVKAMEHWFSHYDTSVPHKGIMIAEDTSDPATRTSSIKNRPVQSDFCIFHYGQGNGMGMVLGNDVDRES